MKVYISLVSDEPEGALESLDDWLRGERELVGRVTVTGSEPLTGELGVLGDALMVAVGSGGTLSVLAASLKAWLSQPRRSDVRVQIEDGERRRSIQIDASRVKVEDVEKLLSEVVGKRIAED